MGYALITGASKGIGKAIAEELASRKLNLLLVARSQALLESVSKEITDKYKVQVDYFSIDLSSPDAAQKVFNWCIEKKYSIEVLVNNAGYGLSGPFEKYTVAENTNMMQVNMMAPVQLCQLFLPVLKEQQKGYILNIASCSIFKCVCRH